MATSNDEEASYGALASEAPGSTEPMTSSHGKINPTYSWKAAFSIAMGLLLVSGAAAWYGVMTYQQNLIASYYARSHLYKNEFTCSSCAVIFPSR